MGLPVGLLVGTPLRNPVGFTVGLNIKANANINIHTTRAMYHSVDMRDSGAGWLQEITMGEEASNSRKARVWESNKRLYIKMSKGVCNTRDGSLSRHCENWKRRTVGWNGRQSVGENGSTRWQLEMVRGDCCKRRQLETVAQDDVSRCHREPPLKEMVLDEMMAWVCSGRDGRVI